MKKVDITAIRVYADFTEVDWHRYNTEDANNDSSGTWQIKEGITIFGVLEYALAHVDDGIEVNLKLNSKQ
jgi:hypothetical protein